MPSIGTDLNDTMGGRFLDGEASRTGELHTGPWTEGVEGVAGTGCPIFHENSELVAMTAMDIGDNYFGFSNNCHVED